MESLTLELSKAQQAILAPILEKARQGRMTPATPLASIRWTTYPEERRIALDVMLVSARTADSIRKVIIKTREKALARTQTPKRGPEAPPRGACAQDSASPTTTQPAEITQSA